MRSHLSVFDRIGRSNQRTLVFERLGQKPTPTFDQKKPLQSNTLTNINLQNNVESSRAHKKKSRSRYKAPFITFKSKEEPLSLLPSCMRCQFMIEVSSDDALLV